jgi:O-succinylbenzoic acid--CoA ligase
MSSIQINGLIRPLEFWIDEFKNSNSENEVELGHLLAQIKEGKSFYCYSSGSTGEPKRLRLGIDSAKVSAQNTLDFFGLKQGDSCLMCLPATSIAGKMMVIRAWVGGLNLIVEEPSLSPNLTEDFDFASFSPAQISNLVENKVDLSKIKHILIGGARIPSKLEDKLSDMHDAVYHSYGMTETYSHVALRKLGSREFKLLPGIEIELTDKGCLKLGADYLGSFPIETKDLVELKSDKSFIYLGRTDDVINSDGKKLLIQELEDKLSEHIKKPFYIVKKEHERFGERPVIVIENPTPEENYQEEVKKILAEQLEKIEQPDEIVLKDQFDYAHSSKLLKHL